MPAVSVIVPVYNVEDCLPQCMDSIRCQTLEDIEIVCVVDGSTDASEQILRLYERVEPRLRIICKENGGLSSARNAGIDAAKAPILMFVDSDDAIVPDACMLVLAAFEALDIEMLTFGAICEPDFEANDWERRVLSPRSAYYGTFDSDVMFKEQSHPYVWRTAVRRELLDREGIRFDETRRFGEDEIFHFEAYPKSRGIAFIPDKLYKYRMARPNSLMATRGSDRKLLCAEHLAIAERICAAWQRYGLIEPNGTAMMEWAAEFVVYHCMTLPNAGWKEFNEQIQSLFGTYFKPDYAYGMKFGPPLQELCATLARGASLDRIEELRVAYLTFNRYCDEEGESWLPLPNKMLAAVRAPAGKARRRKNQALKEELRKEWDAADRRARLRSLEQLRREVTERG